MKRLAKVFMTAVGLCLVSNWALAQEALVSVTLASDLGGVVYDVAVDSEGNIFATVGAGDCRVAKIAASDLSVSTIASGTDVGCAHGLVVDAMGNLYIASYAHHKIYKRTSDGILTVFAGTGEGVNPYEIEEALGGANSLGDGGPATEARLIGPDDVAVDSAGRVFLAEYRTIRMIDSSGIISTVGNYRTLDSSVFPGVDINQIAVDPGGKVFFSNNDNIYSFVVGDRSSLARLTSGGVTNGFVNGLVFDPARGLIFSEGPTRSSRLGLGLIKKRAIDGSFSVLAEIYYPNGLALDPAGRIVFTSGSSVARLGPPSADLSLSLSAPALARDSGPMNYRLTVRNNGPQTANDVTVRDTLAPDTSFISATPSPGATCAHEAGTVTCSLGSLASGASAVITIRVNVLPRVLENRANVAATTADPDTANNSSVSRTRFTVSPRR